MLGKTCEQTPLHETGMPSFFESGRALASCQTRAAALGGPVHSNGVARK